jgi:multicomponent Na+:H+ antiporter subunit E
VNHRPGRARTWAALSAWCLLIWVLLTWTATVEVLLTGVGVAVACSAALVALGDVPGPWTLLRPSRLVPVMRLAWTLATQVSRANVAMARRVWAPRPPPRTGMVVVPTRARSNGEVATVALLTSLVVDNQVVDVDPSSMTMLYHSIDVPPGQDRYDAINGPLERLIRAVGAEP